jgi:hypothetical protein
MSLRFYRRLRVLPGMTVNLSKRGASVSLGERGARVTLNTRGEVTETVGLPGTGVFYTQRQKLRGRQANIQTPSNRGGMWAFLAIVAAIIVAVRVVAWLVAG